MVSETGFVETAWKERRSAIGLHRRQQEWRDDQTWDYERRFIGPERPCPFCPRRKGPIAKAMGASQGGAL